MGLFSLAFSYFLVPLLFYNIIIIYNIYIYNNIIIYNSGAEQVFAIIIDSNVILMFNFLTYLYLHGIIHLKLS